MDKTLQLKRLPVSNHPSLKAWSAADELMIASLPENYNSIGLYNDSFGYLTGNLAGHNPFIITDLKSQETAILENLSDNEIPFDPANSFKLTGTLPQQIELALLKVPKSLTLFETCLQHIHAHLEENGQVICGFMTKYFNNGLLKLGEKYFKNVQQSRAYKKARLLILSGKNEAETTLKTEVFQYHQHMLKQYRGVFSSGKVDKATHFLLQHLKIPNQHHKVLDLACGNGIIGKWILDKTTVEKMHFLDDSHLALSSAMFNIEGNKAIFHHAFNLSDFENNSIDWIVTNPPFHFENTIDTSIPINLFAEAYTKLHPGGILTIVANSNLGYESFLKKIFETVEIQKSNHQFKIYSCQKQV